MSSKTSGAPARARTTSTKPKNKTADGSRKQRWSAAERRDQGRPPRRSSGRNHVPDERTDRTRTDRERTNRPRTDRPRTDRARTDVSRSGDRYERSDRPRFERTDRPRSDRNDRDDRPRSERSDRPRFERDDRNDRPRFERNDPPRFERNDRPRFERTDRPRFERNDRPRFERNDRPAESDQMSWSAPEAATTASAPVPTSGGFAELGLPKVLVSAMAAAGITEPFPIQAATIPDALAGRDVLGRGRTGSGKTLGFGLPMITNLAGSRAPSGCARALVLVPTRELALQVADVLAPLARTMDLELALVAGGMAYGPQLKAFQRGVDIVVATPGRLIDLMDQGAADLTRVEVVVLDEADHMADLGFMPAVTQILDTVPAGGQRLLFSATLDRAVDKLVRRYLSNPVTHEVDPGQASIGSMVHHVLLVQPADKALLTAEIAGREGRTVIFVRTQRGADRVAEQLRDAGVLAGALHGGLTQGARARMLAAFKDGRLPVLVATDVAARGIHVDEIGLVLQVDPPAGPKDYLHRAGRTARAGETGVVVTLALPHQRREVTRLTQQAGVMAQPQNAELGGARLAEATGARTPNGVPVTRQEFDLLVAPPARESRRGSKDGQRRPFGQRSGGAGRRPRR